jgi:indolepyruvate ferredoxin oxidoreductase, beta subunit
MSEKIDVIDGKKTMNIFLVGVGGQGIMLASKILESVCASAGLEVKQTNGQDTPTRGGSITSHVRFGAEVFSPMIEKGGADILLSFELLESMRWLEYLSAEGTAIVNNHRVDPMTIASGKAKYPQRIIDVLKVKSKHLAMVDGQTLARKSGNLRTVNVILLGVLSKYLEFNEELWIAAIEKHVPENVLELNKKGFYLGRNNNI